MLTHTMIVSFTDPIPDEELDQFLDDMKDLLEKSGLIRSFAAARHIRVPGDDHAPVFVASAVVQLTFDDLDALTASFAIPGLEEMIGRWQARHPYRVVWANHEALA